MKADGSFFIAGKDPLTGVLGPEHPGRTRAVSSVVGIKKALGYLGGKKKKKVTIEDLEGMRAQMMQDMETIVRAKVMEELAVRENNTTLQGHSTGHFTGVSAVSVDTFDDIEVILACKCFVYNLYYSVTTNSYKELERKLHGHFS